ncbi:MAG: hypothetical protein Q4A72_05415 [Bacillota bacterium]|nr:hypothetical protein [Bacillota bacterium]
MKFDGGTWWLVVLIIGAITSSLTYLIKFALFSRLEKMEKKIDEFEKSLVDKENHEKDISEVKKDIETIKANYTPKSTHTKDYDECRSDIRKITENYITKEDFFREQLKMDKKLDKIMDILLSDRKKEKDGISR